MYIDASLYRWFVEIFSEDGGISLILNLVQKSSPIGLVAYENLFNTIYKNKKVGMDVIEISVDKNHVKHQIPVRSHI